MPGNHIILFLLWTVYCLLHSLLASIAIKKTAGCSPRQSIPVFRLVYTIFAFVFLVYILYYQFSIETMAVFKTLCFPGYQLYDRFNWIGYNVYLHKNIL